MLSRNMQETLYLPNLSIAHTDALFSRLQEFFCSTGRFACTGDLGYHVQMQHVHHITSNATSPASHLVCVEFLWFRRMKNSGKTQRVKEEICGLKDSLPKNLAGTIENRLATLQNSKKLSKKLAAKGAAKDVAPMGQKDHDMHSRGAHALRKIVSALWRQRAAMGLKRQAFQSRWRVE